MFTTAPAPPTTVAENLLVTETTNAMDFSQVYAPGKFCLSYELFPPKTDRGMDTLVENVNSLLAFDASYITCTYGAGGSTRAKTLETLARVREISSLPLASHLTCVDATVDDLRTYLREAQQHQIDFIVAIRGDPPQGESEFKPVDGGLSYGNELVEFLRAEFPAFGIAVGGYPETHTEAPSPEIDLENLKRKVDAGADVVITQLFYDNEDFFRFRDKCETAGIHVPIVPGILPVTNLQQIKRITSLCAAKIPTQLMDRLQANVEDPGGQLDVGVYHATRQVEELVSEGVPGVHFYILNKSEATSHVLRALNLPPKN